MKYQQMKAPDHPDPFKPYGSNPVTVESIRVRRQHALDDESRRYFAETQRARAENEANIARINAHFDAEDRALLFGVGA